MKTVVYLAMVGLLIGRASSVNAEPQAKAQPSLEQLLIGTWKGGGGCDGNYLFRGDGTYELTEFGPGHCDSTGTWKLCSDSLPATLVLTCKKSDAESEVGKSSEVKVLKLDDKNLAIGYKTDFVGRYTRLKK
jgi:hypothetical protein